MNRERATRVALLAYPPDVRERVGHEMTATLLDASAGSRTRFRREIAALDPRGRQRARPAHGGDRDAPGPGRRRLPGRRVADDARPEHAARADGRGVSRTRCSRRGRSSCSPSPSRSPSSATTGRRGRGAGLDGRALPVTARPSPGHGCAVVAVTLPSVVCFAVLVVAPRRRAPDPRRLGWLVVPVTLVATFGPAKDDQSPVLFAVVAVAAVLVVVYALATLTPIRASRSPPPSPSAPSRSARPPPACSRSSRRWSWPSPSCAFATFGARRRSDRSSVRRCPQRPAVRRGWQRAARRIASGPCSRTRPS